MKFTHLHVHSHYSLLDGLSKIDELVRRAGQLGFDSLALTDHGVLYGAIEFYQKATKAGIKPIIGCELYIATEGMRDKRPGIDHKRYHLTALARSYEGYKNLLEIVTQAHLEGFYYKPRADKELLKKHAAGISALSGCLNSEISQAILARKINAAERLIADYQDIFGKEHFYLELGAHPGIPEQKIVNDALIALSKKTGAKLVGVNDIHYTTSDDRDAQDVLVSVQTGNRIDDENRLTMKGDDFSMKSTDAMLDFFRDIPEAVANTHEIADGVHIEIPMGKPLLPPFQVPDDTTPDRYLETLVRTGIERRHGADILTRTDAEAAAVQERIQYELEIIRQTGFSTYFLIVQDLVGWARKHGIMVGPGRGSAPGSLVSYALGITNIDPLAYNLVFERFLNPSRITMPDIDLDFSDRRRDEVIEYAAQTYGRDHVAQIITFGTMAARAAIRDTGRALGMPYTFCDTAAKMIPFHTTLGEALEKVPEFKELYASRDDAKRLIDTARKLEGVARHASTHACGVVITPEALTHYLPLQLATRGGHKSGNGNGNGNGNGESEKVVVTQYEMHAVEDLGLLKIDFLGLRNLSIIEEAAKLIRERHNIPLDLDALTLNDRDTFRLFREGKTTGIFQFESQGMKRYLKDLQPTEFEDLIAMVSLYRPGPMDLLPSFIARKHGRERITYLHPKLEPILKPTYGIGVYQEQMMQITRDLAGFSFAEADTMRRAIGKKIKSLLDEQRGKLIEGMVKNGIPRKTAEDIWELFPPFARYGFNKSHATCYALIAYQTAYLKAHWPADFMASLMTAEGFEVERVAFLVDEARSMGLSILAPSVNSSRATFTVVSDKEIRFGLGSIKNVGTNIVDAIIAAREAGGPFVSIDDFVGRVQSKDLNKKSLESLIKCGALDELGERGLLLANLDRVLEYAREIQKAAAMGQSSLFGGAEAGPAAMLSLDAAEPAAKRDRLTWEKELLGLYLSEHPLDDYRDRLAKKVTAACAALGGQPRDTLVTVGGLVSGAKRITTKAGAAMLFVQLEDHTGKTEVLVFPRLLEKSAAMWQVDKVLLVRGRVSRDRDEPKILADAVTEVS
ncbi:DNA polymerase III subunit alpha [Candidatus Parcubacteria bacterium]|nr:MAG: DNA polymerase III subunit alpha [Candidatus Parcubacteria bacterium]